MSRSSVASCIFVNKVCFAFYRPEMLSGRRRNENVLALDIYLKCKATTASVRVLLDKPVWHKSRVVVTL